jgi:penicillin-binding protein 1C
MGFTERYTVGVWVGNFSGAPMWDVSGITGAAPVWRDIVEHLHATQASLPPRVPPHVVQEQVVFRPAIEASRKDWFIVDAKHPRATRAGVHEVVYSLPPARPQLVAPPHAAVIAPDPDIPQRLQSILLQASGGASHCMRLDGKAVARCGEQKRMLPLPGPGRHRLELVDETGRVLDVHEFEVRPISAPRRASARK